MTYEHHIHYDGSGYPRHEEPRELNMASLLLCITDTYDNLRRNRPEQAALNLTQALNLDGSEDRLKLPPHPLQAVPRPGQGPGQRRYLTGAWENEKTLLCWISCGSLLRGLRSQLLDLCGHCLYIPGPFALD
jgi:hypothetical protein